MGPLWTRDPLDSPQKPLAPLPRGSPFVLHLQLFIALLLCA